LTGSRLPGLSSRSEARRLASLAWPVMLTSVQWIVLNLIDTMMVGHAGALELAYMNAGRVLTWTSMNVAFGLLSGIIVFAARADGAGDRKACGAIFRQGIAYSVVIAVVVAVGLILGTAPAMAFLRIPSDQRAGGVSFTQILAVAMFFRISSLPITYFLEGVSRPRPAMIFALLTLPLNAVLNWIFIFGKFGMPALGANGAALGTLLSVFAEEVCLWIYIFRFEDRMLFGLGGAGLGSWKGSWAGGRALRMFGLAPAFAAATENFGFSMMGVLAAQLGAVAAASFQAVIALHITALSVAIGCASAAGVRVGNAVGERAFGDIARRGWLASGLAVASAVIFSVLYIAFPESALRLFSDNRDVLMAAKIMLLLVTPFILFDAWQIVLVYALRAAGDPVFAALNQTFSFLIVMVVVAWSAIYAFNLGVAGIALGMIAGVLVSATALVARFVWITRRNGTWIADRNLVTLANPG
jgi:multidrug resistance protein, MATE family